MNYAIPIVCDIRKSKTLETVKRSIVARGWEEGQINRQSTEDFWSSETVLHDTMMVDSCLHICV